MISEDVRAVPAYWCSPASSEVMQPNESPEAKQREVIFGDAVSEL